MLTPVWYVALKKKKEEQRELIDWNSPWEWEVI